MRRYFIVATLLVAINCTPRSVVDVDLAQVLHSGGSLDQRNVLGGDLYNENEILSPLLGRTVRFSGYLSVSEFGIKIYVDERSAQIQGSPALIIKGRGEQWPELTSGACVGAMVGVTGSIDRDKTYFIRLSRVDEMVRLTDSEHCIQ